MTIGEIIRHGFHYARTCKSLWLFGFFVGATSGGGSGGGAGPLTCVISDITLTPVTKTQVYLRREELDALHAAAERSGRSVADLVREAVRRVWLRGEASGPVAIWDGPVAQSSADHDRIYDRR